MTSEPFVVVGGDAAGLSAASKCRREAPDRDVIVFEKGRWVSYAHCGQPYFIAGRVEKLTDLLSLSPEDAAERGIDLRRGHEVLSVDPADQLVRVQDTASGRVFDQPYGDLLIGTGGRATSGQFDVSGLAGVFTLHGLDDAAAIDAYIADPDAYDRSRLGHGPVDTERVEHNRTQPAPQTAAIVTHSSAVRPIGRRSG